jgi:hypothetical protein
MFAPDSRLDGRDVKIFRININSPYDWQMVDEYINSNGKFDFSICSHTLEDISNPSYVMTKLAEISCAGFIAVPSKYVEMSRFETLGYKYRGYIHHRWVFSIRDSKFIGYPKIPFLEQDPAFDSIASTAAAVRDLSFMWKESIPFEIVNNDYLGPNVDAVIGYYKQLLHDDLDEST